MDVREKREVLTRYCSERNCGNCVFCYGDDYCGILKEQNGDVVHAMATAPDEMVEKWYMTAFPAPTFKNDAERMEYIRSKLDENELLCQLAEEAAELSKAASKLARIVRGKNPTPVTKQEALDNVFEELADVRVCMIALGYDKYDLDICLLMPDKIKRWVERLQKMGGDE